jgi:hypothetical protein
MLQLMRFPVSTTLKHQALKKSRRIWWNRGSFSGRRQQSLGSALRSLQHVSAIQQMRDSKQNTELLISLVKLLFVVIRNKWPDLDADNHQSARISKGQMTSS